MQVQFILFFFFTIIVACDPSYSTTQSKSESWAIATIGVWRSKELKTGKGDGEEGPGIALPYHSFSYPSRFSVPQLHQWR